MASSSPQPSPPPPLPTLGAAWRSAGEALSFSSTRARHDAGVHLHRIDSYSKLDGMALPGQRVESAPFRAGGHEWQLRYYPNGGDRLQRDRVAAVDLVLTGGPWWRPFYRPRDVTAAYKVSILDGDGNCKFSKEAPPQCFRYRGSSGAGVNGVVKVEELRSALQGAKDDGLIVRCDVTVLSLEKESRIMWFLRQLVK